MHKTNTLTLQITLPRYYARTLVRDANDLGITPTEFVLELYKTWCRYRRDRDWHDDLEEAKPTEPTDPDLIDGYGI